MPELSIPNLSPVGWEPGVDVGVIGGIDQYRPGGASARTVLHDVTAAPFSVDNTGATSVNSAIQTNIIATVGTNEVCYFPYGVYKMTGNVYSSYLSNFTYRGAGAGVNSTSSVTIGTGTKVFTVPAGLGWTNGIGCRVWHVTERRKWMQGTVTSYSGTTLTLSITSTSGHTDTLAFWTVGQTVLVGEGAAGFSSATSASTLGRTAITSSPSAGATTFTVADGSGLYVEPARCVIDILPETNDEVYSTGPFWREVRRTVNYITDVTGNTVTVAHPLIYDLPAGRSPEIAESSLNCQGIGVEELAFFGDGVSEGFFFSFDGLYNSWLYRCEIGIMPSYEVGLAGGLRCEIAYCYIGETDDGLTPSASAISSGGANRCLVRHNIINWSIVTEGIPDYNNAYLYNLGTNVGWAINHGGGSDYNYYEGNIVPFMHADGYHGGCKRYTFIKNWFRGPLFSLPEYGMLIHNRFSREHNTVGNVMGWTGIAQGLHSQGEPNSGGAPSYGTANSTEYVDTGGVSGSLWIHMDATSNPLATGELTDIDGDEATVTLDTLTLTDFTDPNLISPYATLVWGTVASPQSAFGVIVEGSSSGSNIVFQKTSGTFPALSTAVKIMPFAGGYQEQDDAVAYSAFLAENYKYGVAGAAGSISNPTSDTLPDSLAYAAEPSDWPNALTWPPAISPDSPDVGDSVIPAQVYYNTGLWPDSPAPPSGESTTFTGSGSTTFTGSGSVTFA